MTSWTEAELDGRPIPPSEMAADCLLLLDGGAATTRTVIARTLLNLIRVPPQWEALRAGADIAPGVEEFIRFVTPIHNICRVATRGCEIGDVTIKAGEQVVLLYGSANRDPAHFSDPSASTSPAGPTSTSRSVSAPTSASARVWRGWRSGSSSKSSSAG